MPTSSAIVGAEDDRTTDANIVSIGATILAYEKVTVGKQEYLLPQITQE